MAACYTYCLIQLLSGHSRVFPLKKVLRMKCCQENCTKDVAGDAAKRTRSSFDAKTLREQADWIKGYLEDHHAVSTKFMYQFVVGLRSVCCTAWRLINGLTKSRFYVLKKEFEGIFHAIFFPYHHPNQSINVERLKTKANIIWHLITLHQGGGVKSIP